jgi:transposase
VASERGIGLSGFARGVALKRRERRHLKSDVPATVAQARPDKGEALQTVMIGADPHKGSHTAAAIDGTEAVLGDVRVRANDDQLGRLLEWAAHWPERNWAVENAGGLGYLLAQQLVAAGERVLDVPPKLGARVRLLASGDTNKNDPNDARSVAAAALRSPSVRPVAAEDHQAVMRLWAKRRQSLTVTRKAIRKKAIIAQRAAGRPDDPAHSNSHTRTVSNGAPPSLSTCPDSCSP